MGEEMDRRKEWNCHFLFFVPQKYPFIPTYINSEDGLNVSELEETERNEITYWFACFAFFISREGFQSAIFIY